MLTEERRHYTGITIPDIVPFYMHSIGREGDE